jgi:hypothetical protein
MSQDLLLIWNFQDVLFEPFSPLQSFQRTYLCFGMTKLINKRKFCHLLAIFILLYLIKVVYAAKIPMLQRSSMSKAAANV